MVKLSSDTEATPFAAPIAPGLLDYVDLLDAAWHGADAVDTCRTTLARWWGINMAGARLIDPEIGRATLKSSTVLRGMRPVGVSADARGDGFDRIGRHSFIFLESGSTLGHRRGQAAWVVQMVPPARSGGQSRFRCLQRVRAVRRLVEQRFSVPALAVLLDADDGVVPQRFDSETLVLGGAELARASANLAFTSIWDMPGAMWDRTLVKLGLLRTLAAKSPKTSGPPTDIFAMSRDAHRLGWPLRRPVAGPMNFDDDPAPLAEWRERHPESPAEVRLRLTTRLQELEQAGMIEDAIGRPRLTLAGGDVVLALMEHFVGHAR